MSISIALAGNPNSGKSTLFNNLTGAAQYVGNWPGVTVEKKSGRYKKDKSILLTDLPGIYSLSPYTLEEVVSRGFLLDSKVDVIIDVIDATNMERNLYLATQLSEIGVPVVLALNMMDVVERNKDKIDTAKLEKLLGIKVVEISALHNKNIDLLMETAKKEAGKTAESGKIFPDNVEEALCEIAQFAAVSSLPSKRWLSVKLFENDKKILEKYALSKTEEEKLVSLRKNLEAEYEDDAEGIITDSRYSYVSSVTKECVMKKSSSLTLSDKIDKVVTNRFLALPIFACVMYAIYYFAVGIVGGPVNDWVNDTFFGEIVGGSLQGFLEGLHVSEWLVSLLVDGIVGGVGAVLGFLPVIVALFLCIAILEDSGYMARIAFILDRIFRRFGLSGKSFIPILIGTGCSVPAIMGTRTIENDNDRKMTIMVSSFMPCGAKTAVIALFAAFFTDSWWYGPIWYFGGILAVIISGIILKKTRFFSGEAAPFVMELPEYHFPSVKNVLRATYFRGKAFVVKAGTVILLMTVVIWFLQNISVTGKFAAFDSASTDSILAFVGKKLAIIFAPLGFYNWMAAVSTILGLVAKEVVVGTYGVVAGLGDVEEDAAPLIEVLRTQFNSVSVLSFVFFNQLTIPCFAAMGAIKSEMGDNKWFAFATLYQIIFSYTIALMIYQFGSLFLPGASFSAGTMAALVILAVYLYLIFRPEGKKMRIREAK